MIGCEDERGDRSQSIVWLALKWCSVMLLLGSPFLVARLCSFSSVVNIAINQ